MNFMVFFNMMCNFSVFSSGYWLVVWVIMELVSFSFVSILSYSESGIVNKIVLWKYFLFQSFGSMLFFISMIMADKTFISTFFLILSMFIKMGLPPFHSWLLEVSDCISWTNFFLMGSFQKIIPLYLIWSIKENVIVLLSAFMIMFSIFSLYDWSIRRFLIYSSIVNVGWIMLSSVFSTLSFLLSFSIYSMTLFSIVLILKEMKLSEFFSIFVLGKNWSVDLNFFLSMNLFSLMGIPPFGGFLMKYDILMLLVKNDFYMLSGVILFFTLLMVFMYLYIFIIFFYSSKIFNYSSFPKMPLMIISMIQFFWIFIYFF